MRVLAVVAVFLFVFVGLVALFELDRLFWRAWQDRQRRRARGGYFR